MNSRKTKGIDLRKDPMALQRLKESAEKAKIELSSSTETEINLPISRLLDGVPKAPREEADPRKFEQLADQLFARCLKPANRH